MRPNAKTISTELYECTTCGKRLRAPATPACDHCGGELRNIGRSRDL